MTLQELFAALAHLDPKLEVNLSVFLKTPGDKPPVKILGGQVRKPRVLKVARFSAQQLAEWRERCLTETFAQIAKSFNIHRATVSRYINAEIKAGRMGKQGRGIGVLKGAYDLETKLPLATP